MGIFHSQNNVFRMPQTWKAYQNPPLGNFKCIDKFYSVRPTVYSQEKSNSYKIFSSISLLIIISV